MAVDEDGGRSPFYSLKLTHSVLTLWYALIVTRSILAMVGWLLLCRHASPRAYVLPPYPYPDRGSLTETRPLTHG